MERNEGKAPAASGQGRAQAGKPAAPRAQRREGRVPAWLSARGGLDSYYGPQAYEGPYVSRTGD